MASVEAADDVAEAAGCTSINISGGGVVDLGFRVGLEMGTSSAAGAQTGERLGGGGLSPMGDTDSKGGQFSASTDPWGRELDMR